MTDHPCEGMTANQVAAFERIAVNLLPDDGWRSIDALLKRGVVERGPDTPHRDAMGPYTTPTFHVPLPVHMQWCQWCSEQPENRK